MIEISEHENGAYHVENFIDNIIHEKGDFVDGGLYDGIDVTDLLNPLREVFPDITDIDDFQEKEDPRLVSPVADRLKEFLTKEVRKKERPFETYAMEAITQTGQTFKEIFTVPYVLGKGLIDTISKVLDFPDWVNDQPALVQLVYKMGTVHSSSNELSNDDRKTFYEYSNYYFPPANKPQTILGQLALSGAEFGLAYATGRAIDSRSDILMLAEDMPSTTSIKHTDNWGMKIESFPNGIKRFYGSKHTKHLPKSSPNRR